MAAEAAAAAAQVGVIGHTTEAKAGYALGLRLAVGLSVGTATVIGVIRILKGWRIEVMLNFGYSIGGRASSVARAWCYKGCGNSTLELYLAVHRCGLGSGLSSLQAIHLIMGEPADTMCLGRLGYLHLGHRRARLLSGPRPARCQTRSTWVYRLPAGGPRRPRPALGDL